MKNTFFLESDIKDMQKTLAVVISDLRGILDASQLKEICIWFGKKIEAFDLKEWILYINKERMLIYQIDPLRPKDLTWARKKEYLEWTVTEKTGFLKNKLIEERVINNLPTIDSQNNVANFLMNYEDIRTDLINYIQSNTKNREEVSKKLSTLRAKYSNEVYIDFGISQTQNVKTIELTEDETGQKVGTINFGSKTIKIITDGDIVLTKREETKTKRK